MKREQGFYWVKLDGAWRIAEYSDDAPVHPAWILHCGSFWYNDNDFDEINETRLLPPS